MSVIMKYLLTQRLNLGDSLFSKALAQASDQSGSLTGCEGIFKSREADGQLTSGTLSKQSQDKTISLEYTGGSGLSTDYMIFHVMS